MIAAKTNKTLGFTIAEMLVALAVMAILLTAVAVAFNASAMNYNENTEMFNSLNTGRQAMLRITNQLRTAQQVPDTVAETNPTVQCSFTPADSNQICRFRYDSNAKTVYLDSNGHSYALCNNVAAMTFNRTPATGIVKRVLMSMTITVGNQSQTIPGAVVIRKTL
jgi:prepilin-type N-terminal cleavage/methylation domain-containing protein